MGQPKVKQFMQVNLMLEAVKFPEVNEVMLSWPPGWLVQFLQAYPENYEILKEDYL